jgi:hypothetical protein
LGRISKIRLELGSRENVSPASNKSAAADGEGGARILLGAPSGNALVNFLTVDGLGSLAAFLKQAWFIEQIRR